MRIEKKITANDQNKRKVVYVGYSNTWKIDTKMRFSSLNLFTETVIQHTNKQHDTPIDTWQNTLKNDATPTDNITHQ